MREHAVTAGWLLGLALQLPVVALSYAQHKQRLGALSAPGQAIAFYCHNVVLRALGWHLSVWLKAIAGYNGATAIVGAALALAVGWAFVAGDGRSGCSPRSPCLPASRRSPSRRPCRRTW